MSAVEVLPSSRGTLLRGHVKFFLPLLIITLSHSIIMLQINDDIFAYHFYLDKGRSSEAEAKRLVVEKGWFQLSEWIATAQLSAQLDCLSLVLKTGWSLDDRKKV